MRQCAVELVAKRSVLPQHLEFFVAQISQADPSIREALQQCVDARALYGVEFLFNAVVELLELDDVGDGRPSYRPARA